jgi:hypothetical protein
VVTAVFAAMYAVPVLSTSGLPLLGPVAALKVRDAGSTPTGTT